MGRKELEKQLKALGWFPLSQASGKGHTAWYHRTLGRLSVPNEPEHILNDRVCADILNRAKG